jgi:O-antigen ligase
MQLKNKIRYPSLLLSFLYILGIYFFYIKYVPLIPKFQYVLFPILLLVTLVTAFNLEVGGLCFIFFFPLINSLPYFFEIYENTPHAPTALVLFLAYFLGILLRTAFFKDKFDLRLQVFQPMILFLSLVLISGIFTFLRYANFYPILSNSIYELTTNTYGVSAGGAIMSVIFSSLNYMTSFVFFFLMVNQLKSKNAVNKILFALIASTLLSIGFGMFQQISSIDIGKNLLNTELAMVNGTFKDSISFGTFLAMIIPLFLGGIFAFKGAKRILSLICLGAALYLLFYTGSKIALVSAFISPIFFVLFSLRFFRQKKIISIAFFLLVVIIASFSVLSKYGTLSKSISTARIQEMVDRGALSFLSYSRGVQWKSAIAMARDYPLTGVGVGAYIVELPNYAKPYSRKAPDSAENYFLQVASEMGFIGLMPILWIFGTIAFLILKRLWRRYKAGNNPFLQIGLVLAIGTYCVHIFFHTYIGSYEIKYLFWLLVAVTLFGSHDENSQKQSAPSQRNFRLVCAITLILFAGIHLWNSAHSLSLGRRTKELKLKHNFGFYPAEQTHSGLEFSWSKKAAGLSVMVDKPVLEISLQASHPDIGSNPVHVKISLIKDLFREKRVLEEVTLMDNGWRRLKFKIPEEFHTDIILFIEVDRVWNPHKILGTEDDRDIGVALSEIHFLSDHQQIP